MISYMVPKAYSTVLKALCSKNLTLLTEYFVDHILDLFINSSTAIARAIIGLLLVFLQFKEFELYWGAVFFLRLDEEYWFS